MNCNWMKDNLVLYMYDELADDAKYEFEHHLRQCATCREEVESALAFKDSMSARPVREVSPNLLASSRMKLQEALEETQQLRGWGRIGLDLAGWMQQIKLAPALTVALLMIGFAGGALTSYRIAISKIPPAGVQPPAAAEASIAGVDSIVQDANSKRVMIRYNTLAPQTVEGTTDDPRIQELLVLGARNPGNPDVRLQSIGLLKANSAATEIREALIGSLRADKNPGVRLEVLNGLAGYVLDDVHVRDALVEALIHDTNPGIRAKAVEILTPMAKDTSVREALKMIAQSDKDDFIRSECRRILANTPAMD